jgi:hypothetical protein
LAARIYYKYLSTYIKLNKIAHWLQQTALSPIGKHVSSFTPSFNHEINRIVQEADPTDEIEQFLEGEYLKYMPTFLKAESIK